MSLETNIKKLEDLVRKIESQNISIEESLSLYEKAIELSHECLKDVKKYKGSLSILSKELEKITLEESDD